MGMAVGRDIDTSMMMGKEDIGTSIGIGQGRDMDIDIENALGRDMGKEIAVDTASVQKKEIETTKRIYREMEATTPHDIATVLEVINEISQTPSPKAN
jgi:hypothetical protein